jgi:hypothetical protein
LNSKPKVLDRNDKKVRLTSSSLPWQRQKGGFLKFECGMKNWLQFEKKYGRTEKSIRAGGNFI